MSNNTNNQPQHQQNSYFSFNSALNKIKSTLKQTNTTDANAGSLLDEDVALTANLLLNTYSNKKYAKWFAITATKTHESGNFTIYKIIYRFVPNDLNERVKELVVWKRFRDVQELYKVLSKYHQSLHRRQVFPEFVKTTYFTRFDSDTIEERKECILKLLQFCGTQPHLYSHEKFIEFFSEGNINDHSINADNVLKPNVLNVQQQPQIQQKQATNDTLPDIDAEKIYTSLTELIKLNDDSSQSPLEQEKQLTQYDYIKKALAYIQEAIFNEKISYYFASFDLYKLAVATLIKGTQNEFNQVRIQIIKENTKKLLIKAEQIIKLTSQQPEQQEQQQNEQQKDTNKTELKDESDLNRWKIDLHKYTHELEPYLSKYCGSLSELNENFMVKKVLLNTIYLVENKNDKLNYILKTKLKTSNSTVNNTNKKSIVPFLFTPKIKYMCKLLKYYETEYTIYLLLDDYKKYSKLYQYLKFTEPVLPINDDNNLKLKTVTSFTCASEINQYNFLAKDDSTAVDLPPIKNVKLYLAQMLLALDSLHSVGIICKDFRSDNILLDDNCNICLTYFSRWSLVDETINEDAVKYFYVAPEISSYMKNDITEACDWWSFGVVCYELITLHRFYDLNFQNSQLNKINYPENTDQTAINLINQLLQTNPKNRLNVDKIKTHEFFQSINWHEI